MRLLLLSITLISASFINAQQTYVPDDNFEAYLENNAMGNGVPNDDYVTTSNISGVSSLIIGGNSIADLTGIEDFAALSTLYCFDNQLSTLDLSQNSNLSDLRCYSNNLTVLNVSQNAGLSTLLCFDNDILALDVSQSTWLTDFSCYNNSLSTLDVTNNPALFLFMCYDNFLTSIDVTQNPQLTNFRCYDNQITSLDVSQNPQLTNLFCYENDLATLDVSGTSVLTDLRCYTNQLTSLDVSQSPALELLLCNDNKLTALDISQNAMITDLFCQDNLLQCLNANNGLNINMDCSNNQLNCASVLSPNWTNVNAVYDAGVSFQPVCQFFLDNDVDQNATTLTAVQNGATYQWIDCEVTDGAIAGETNQSYTPTSMGYYAVEVTLNDPCGGTYVDTSSCHFHYVDPGSASLIEFTSEKAQLVKITDLLGRETTFKPNVTLIYVYSDGTTERVFKLED